jgi:hypothetical protein
MIADDTKKLTEATNPPTWGLLIRIVVKAGLLFALINLLFALLNPLEAIGRITLYNIILPGRTRLPYGENVAQSYNLSLNNIPAMMASHVISRLKAADEFRVLIIGDSGVWGWFLQHDQTLSAYINSGSYEVNGRRIVAYNLGYPVMSLTKDLLLLDAALAYQPDMVVWLVTLESFPPEKQLVAPLVQHNAERVRRLIAENNLNLDPNDTRFVNPTIFERTLVGQRRELANWLRLQTYSFSWAATGIDQYIPDEIPLRQSDFDTDISWSVYPEPESFSANDVAFDVVNAGLKLARDVPVLIVNEPIFISSGQNSDLRYNGWYPRWAYNHYRDLLIEQAETHNWHFLDLWDAIAPEEFTDSPVHLTPQGMEQLSALVVPAIVESVIP